MSEEPMIGLAPVALKRRRKKPGQKEGEWGPTGEKNHGAGIPNANELRHSTWGFLLACAWFANEDIEPPSQEYIEVLASMHKLKVPTMRNRPPEDFKRKPGVTRQLQEGTTL